MHTNMKQRTLIKAFATVALVAAVSPAFADGQIDFQGKVLSTTCSIAGGGGATGTDNLTVKLPNVSLTTLGNADDVAGRTPFSIKLSGCTGDSTKVSAIFESGDLVDAATGRLNLLGAGEEGVAKNVQVGLLNASQQPIVAGAARGQQNSQVVDLKDGGATLQYFAEYHATGTATAGSANTRIKYSLDYQ